MSNVCESTRQHEIYITRMASTSTNTEKPPRKEGVRAGDADVVICTVDVMVAVVVELGVVAFVVGEPGVVAFVVFKCALSGVGVLVVLL